MKARSLLLASLALAGLSPLNVSLSTAFAQGSLTPPGAPAPLMKTLDQIEPRIPISTLPWFISDPGSYYLTTNLTGLPFNYGIVIFADNVTLDLNGFSLVGVPNSFSGIGFFAQRNFRLRNGTIRDWNNTGIAAFPSRNSRFEDLFITGNATGGLVADENALVTGCIASGNGGPGVSVGRGSTITQCSVFGTIGNGIITGDACSVIGSMAVSNTLTGITLGNGSLVSDSIAGANGTNGIATGKNSLATRCSSWANFGDGIRVDPGSSVIACTVSSNGNTGILLTSDGLAMNNVCNYNHIVGINTIGHGSRIEANNVVGFAAIDSGGTNLVIRNSWRGPNYGGIGTTLYGTVETTSAGMNANKNPHANFFLGQ